MRHAVSRLHKWSGGGGEREEEDLQNGTLDTGVLCFF